MPRYAKEEEVNTLELMELILETKKVKRSEYDLVITKTVYKLPISQTTVHLASPRDNGGNQMIRTQISESKI